jgi:hypothetical protein
MMNKSLRDGGRESSSKADYGFRRVRRIRHAPVPTRIFSGHFFIFEEILAATPRAKKEPPFPAAFEVDNREASNRVDRSHSVSKPGRYKS